VTALAPTTLARFPERVCDHQRLDPAERATLAAWQGSPVGRGLYAAVATHLAGRLGLRPGERVLSVGDGEGLLTASLARAVPGLTIVGADVDPEAVATATRERAAADGGLRYAVASAYDLGRLEPADAVLCALTLCHLADPRAAVAEMLARLRPGGRLYVVEPRRDADEAAFARELATYDTQSSTMARIFHDSVRSCWTTGELEALLAPAGAVDARVVALDDAAAAAYRRHDPEAEARWPAVRDAVCGLWHEAVVTPGR